MFSGDLANQLLCYVNKSENRTKDALDSLLVENYFQTLSNLSRAELELRFLENLIRVHIISGDITKELGLEVIYSLRHIRDHIILAAGFLVYSVTDKPEATELGDINLEIAHIIDAIKDSIDDDNTGLEFSRCWDNVSDYLPLVYALAITLNLYNAEDKIYDTLRNILNNNTVVGVKSISVSKFYLKISRKF